MIEPADELHEMTKRRRSETTSSESVLDISQAQELKQRLEMAGAENVTRS